MSVFILRYDISGLMRIVISALWAALYSGGLPGIFLGEILRDFGSCSVGDTRSCMQYSVVLPDGSYAKKVFIATMHYGHVFRIQCPDERCKNLGEYMTNSITVKDTRSN